MRQTAAILMIAALTVMSAFAQQVESRTDHVVVRHPRVKPQMSASTSMGDNVISQVADGGGWQTMITVINLRTTSTTWTLDCYDVNGNPLAFSWSDFGFASHLDGSLNGNGMTEVYTSGTGPLNQGWCYLDTPVTGNPQDVAGIAVFKYLPTRQEVAVPASSQLDSTLILAFDNTAGYSYGIAIVNPDENVCGQFSTSDEISVSFKDPNGDEFATNSIAIAGCGYAVFMLDQQFPVTANRVGTATFTVTSGITLAGLGLRAAPTGSLTSVDLFAPMTE